MEKKRVKDNHRKLTPEERENPGNWKEFKNNNDNSVVLRFKESITFIKGEHGAMKMKNTKNKEEHLEIRDDFSNKTFTRVIGEKKLRKSSKK